MATVATQLFSWCSTALIVYLAEAAAPAAAQIPNTSDGFSPAGNATTFLRVAPFMGNTSDGLSPAGNATTILRLLGGGRAAHGASQVKLLDDVVPSKTDSANSSRSTGGSHDAASKPPLLPHKTGGFKCERFRFQGWWGLCLASWRGAVAAIISAILSATTEPFVQRILVRGMSFGEAYAEVTFQLVANFFLTTFPTNMIKYPFFELLDQLLADAFSLFALVGFGWSVLQGAIAGLVFCTVMLPLLNYRFRKFMGWEITASWLFQGYGIVALREIVYGGSRHLIDGWIRAAYPSACLTIFGEAGIFAGMVFGACVISSPVNELRSYMLQPQDRRLPFCDWFKPINYVRSTLVGSSIMATSLTLAWLLQEFYAGMSWGFFIVFNVWAGLLLLSFGRDDDRLSSLQLGLGCGFSGREINDALVMAVASGLYYIAILLMASISSFGIVSTCEAGVSVVAYLLAACVVGHLVYVQWRVLQMMRKVPLWQQRFQERQWLLNPFDNIWMLLFVWGPLDRLDNFTDALGVLQSQMCDKAVTPVWMEDWEHSRFAFVAPAVHFIRFWGAQLCILIFATLLQWFVISNGSSSRPRRLIVHYKCLGNAQHHVRQALDIVQGLKEEVAAVQQKHEAAAASIGDGFAAQLHALQQRSELEAIMAKSLGAIRSWQVQSSGLLESSSETDGMAPILQEGPDDNVVMEETEPLVEAGVEGILAGATDAPAADIAVDTLVAGGEVGPSVVTEIKFGYGSGGGEHDAEGQIDTQVFELAEDSDISGLTVVEVELPSRGWVAIAVQPWTDDLGRFNGEWPVDTDLPNGVSARRRELRRNTEGGHIIGIRSSEVYSGGIYVEEVICAPRRHVGITSAAAAADLASMPAVAVLLSGDESSQWKRTVQVAFARLVCEAALQNWLSAVAFQATFVCLSPAAKAKVAFSASVSAASVLPKAVDLCKVAVARRGCYSRWAALAILAFVAMFMIGSLFKVYMTFVCEDHLWNMSHGCISRSSAPRSEEDKQEDQDQCPT